MLSFNAVSGAIISIHNLLWTLWSMHSDKNVSVHLTTMTLNNKQHKRHKRQYKLVIPHPNLPFCGDKWQWQENFQDFQLAVTKQHNTVPNHKWCQQLLRVTWRSRVAMTNLEFQKMLQSHEVSQGHNWVTTWKAVRFFKRSTRQLVTGRHEF